MAADAPTDDAPSRPYLRVRAAIAGAAGLGCIAVAALAGAGLATARPAPKDTVQVAQSAANGADDRAEAIGRWLAESSPFPAAPPYTGDCADTGTVGMVCSSPKERVGDAEIHVVGLHASDAGADVLLERTDGGWSVTDAAPWPEPGSTYAGPPWSPMTAITAWWSARAADAYGSPGAVHLSSCGDADGVPEASGQTLLCSTLVEDLGDVRVYDSGRAGAPADVRITVARQPDRTWAVTETLAR